MNKFCEACHKPLKPSLTVDCGVLRNNEKGQLEVLVIQRGRPPFEGSYAFPGGFVDYDENPPDAALRELVEETNLVGKNPCLVAVAGDPLRDPRKHIISILYSIDVPDLTTMKAGDDAATAHFHLVSDFLDENPTKTLAFDHFELMKKLVEFQKQNSSK